MSYDAVIAGAGILGLAHAYHLGKRGLRVVVVERSDRAQGASVRNFGMIWPIGQPPGEKHRVALRSRDLWLHILREAGLWHHECGSLHLAYHEDEEAVLREFASLHPAFGTTVLDANDVYEQFPNVVHRGLRAGLWSRSEIQIDPREVIAKLPELLSRTYGVEFRFGTAAVSWDRNRLLTTGGEIVAERCIACTGADIRELAPEAFADAGLVPCKLQMMRTQPYGPEYRLGTMLAAGLTLRHYKSFAGCPSLPRLAARLDAEFPEYGKYGIHVMASQNGLGELILGDSHEYGDAIEPFDKSRIDELVLDYLARFLSPPNLRIAARWHGIYQKHPTESWLIRHPRPGLMCVGGVGGAGMTMSFGVAEKALEEVR